MATACQACLAAGQAPTLPPDLIPPTDFSLSWHSGMQHFQRQVVLPVPVEEAFAYHQRPGALQRLLPPWQNVSIAASDDSLAPGSRVTLKIRNGGISVRWVAEHTALDPPHLFVDVQRSGPFAAWTHRHQFASRGAGRSELTDRIDYALPLGSLGQAMGGQTIGRQLDAMFAYRHNTTMNDLQLGIDTPLPPQRIAVSGSTGLLGSQLCPLLTQLGHRVDPIVRRPTDREDEIAIWEPSCDDQKLQRLDAVIHLAGKPIAAQRWTSEIKKGIRESRVEKTRALCERLARLEAKPRTLLCASATGFYGDRGDEMLTEQASPGHDFLAGVAEEWEEACRPAAEAGIRVVHLRFGLILSPRGGALEKMLTPTKWFAGGPLGKGDQWWSWIALDDVLGGIYHVLGHEEIRGAVNFTAPEPVRNRQFADTLGKVLHRPAALPAPALGLRMLLGEMADALLLASTRVRPEVLLESGYRFRFPTLEPALRHLLGRPATAPD